LCEPTYSSWLNLVERWFGRLTNDALRRGSHLDVRELRDAIERYIVETNEDPKPLVWTRPPARSSRAWLASARTRWTRPKS
jgi:hypothetical protein